MILKHNYKEPEVEVMVPQVTLENRASADSITSVESRASVDRPASVVSQVI